MSHKNENIFNNININAFNDKITQAVKDAVEKYWEQDVCVILQALNDYRELRQEILIKDMDFFSSQIKVETHKPVIIRLNKNFVKNFLSASLNIKTNVFKLTTLTELEVKILNNFFEFLYKKINEILIPTKNLKISEKSEKNINILLYLTLKQGYDANILLSIPQDRVPFDVLKKSQSFKDEDFLTSKATVKIKAGSSKITLDELKNLTCDDIVLLEDSDSSKLTLISGELEKKFNVKVNSSLILHLDSEEEENYNEQINNEVIMEKNLWDDIQIEISAEFDKVKMTIGELKQITQGQIVDLGSVFDNEISLYVENKKVAKGELLIINDKYAVRLNEVMSSESKKPTTPIQAKPNSAPQPKTAPQQPKPAPTPQPTQQAKPMPRPGVKPQPQPQAKPKQSENEEFDYSDFEK